MMHRITLYVDYSKWLKCLDTNFNKPTNQSSMKVLKVVKPKNKKMFYKTLGTSVLNSSMYPTSLKLNSFYTLQYSSTKNSNCTLKINGK